MRDGVACGYVAVMSAPHPVTEADNSYNDAAGAHSIRDRMSGLVGGRRLGLTHPPSANANWKNDTATLP